MRVLSPIATCIPSPPFASVLRARISHASGHLSSSRQSHLPGNLSGQVFQDGKVQITRYRTRLVGPLCQEQGMALPEDWAGREETDARKIVDLDQAKWRDALSVREPCGQGSPRKDYRRYARASRSGRIQYDRCATRKLSFFLTGSSVAHPFLAGQGFGVAARSTVDTRKLDPTSIIVFNQA